MKQMSKGTWNTYSRACYTYDVANDQRSAGGTHCHEVRHHREGGWQTRIRQSNGVHTSYGPVTPIEAVDGWARFETAKNFR